MQSKKNMVNKSLILKAINESLKCRKESYALIGLSNHVKGAMNQFANSTRNETIEHGVIIDGHGHTLVKVDGNENSVHIPTETTISKILEEKCKDLLDDYQREYNALMSEGKENDTIFLRDKYEKEIYKRIESLKEDVFFNVDHNHPGAYSSAELDYNVFTCLSKADLDNCLLRGYIGMGVGDGGFFIDNIVKSKTAECSNGSRMTLVNNNPPNAMVNVEKFNKARDNLLNTWDEYASVTIKNEALHYAHSLVDSGKYSESDVKRDRNDLRTEIGNDINAYIKKKSLEIFPNMIKDNIKEFEELGFELRVDWL